MRGVIAAGVVVAGLVLALWWLSRDPDRPRERVRCPHRRLR